jgi:hypothetical protein
MNIRFRHEWAASAVVAMLFAGGATNAYGQGENLEDEVLGTPDVADVDMIGRLPENIRRARLRELLHQKISDAYSDYARWKASVQNATNIRFAVDLSLLQQWGVPHGGGPALQVYAAPSLNWTVFTSDTWGTGSVQVAYTAVTHYPTVQNAADIQSNLGLITPINDYPDRSMSFTQFTYTQATPDNKWLFTAGQYALSNFDGNAYLGNQQHNFNNYLFAQNATQTYLLTGLGGYVQFNATSAVQLAAGFQGANNASGRAITGADFSRDCCAWFGYAQWTPKLRGMGSAQYSASYFATPGIPTQAASRGWSINVVQNLNDDWALFARANGASGFVTPIRSSYALGLAMNNPLHRASTDQIAVAVGQSVAAAPPVNPPGARNEKAIEAYWTWTFVGGILLTPSLQIILDPALNPGISSVRVLSVRTTFAF